MCNDGDIEAYWEQIRTNSFSEEWPDEPDEMQDEIDER